ncbi:MAG: hypothetical protein KatS3mg001_361 [Candidatus Pacearchaeota archaeon]|nr:MAG: hypothetical protein KatS3mg001_361 [Candidatus Pacearchaeota archaeon]
MKKLTWVLGFLSAVFFITGFLLVDRSPTANVILEGSPVLNPVSIVGVLFVLASVLVLFYLIKEK